MKIKRIVLVFVMAFMLMIALIGCSSNNGMSWHNGSVDPIETIGVDGDVYLNTETSALFTKVNGKWEQIANLKGEEGVPGLDGNEGPKGEDGIKGNPGATGVGIKVAEIINGELVIVLTDGTSFNLGKIGSDEVTLFPALDARRAFYAKMKEKAATFSIDVDKLTFNSAISESSGSVTPRDMVKIGAMAMGYEELTKIWNKYEYTLVTTGVEKTYNLTSTVMLNANMHYLSDHYYVLGGKGGSLANTAAGKPVSNILIAVEGPEGSTLVGFVSHKATDTANLNRYKMAKIAFDIASLKYLDKDADTNELESQLPSDAMIAVISLPRNGNILSYNHYDWFADDSPYFLYGKNSTEPYYTASSWKTLTSITALDYISDLDAKLVVAEDAIRTGSGPVYTGGEEMTFRDALYTIMLPSSNSTCVALAEAVGQIILRSESSVGGSPVLDTPKDNFDFENAPVISVATAKNNPNPLEIVKVRGVIVGGSNNYDNSQAPTIFIKDETADEIIGIAGMVTRKNAYEANMPFEIGDIVEIPVVSEIVPGAFTYGGEARKLTFTWMGDNLDMSNLTPFLSKYKVGTTTNYLFDITSVTRVIQSQQDLEDFVLSTNYHWEVVILRGTEEKPLKAVTGAATTAGKNDKDMKRQYIRFFYDDFNSVDDQKIGGRTSPALSNFGNLHTLSELLSTLMFNQTSYSQENFDEPYEFVGDVYCFVMGGSTAYFHFIVLDDSWVVPAS